MKKFLCFIGLILLIRFLVASGHHFIAIIVGIIGFIILIFGDEITSGAGGGGGGSCDCAGTPGCY